MNVAKRLFEGWKTSKKGKIYFSPTKENSASLRDVSKLKNFLTDETCLKMDNSNEMFRAADDVLFLINKFTQTKNYQINVSERVIEIKNLQLVSRRFKLRLDSTRWI